MVIIIMGVSGSGKTTVGRLVAQRLRVPFHDADDFHPAANVDRMKAGIALTDEDREPWLRNLAGHIAQWEREGGGVLACWALKERYRRVLASQAAGLVRIVYLQGTPACIARRLQLRAGHYMPAALLESQFAALEPPANAIVESITDAPEVIAEKIVQKLTQRDSTSTG